MRFRRDDASALCRGRARADQPHRFAVARRERSGLPQCELRRVARHLCRRHARADQGRRRSHHDRDGVRHAERQGRDLRHRGCLRGNRRTAAGVDFRHDHRSFGTHADGPDGGSLLAFAPPRRTRSPSGSIARSGRRSSAPMSPIFPRLPIRWSPPIPMPACPTPSAVTTRRPSRWPPIWASSRARASSISSAAAAARRPSISAPSPMRSRGVAPRKIPEKPRYLRLSGLEPFTLTPEIEFREYRRAHQHHGLGQVPQADRGGRLRGRARHRARPGARAARRSSTSTWTRA